MLLSGVTYDNFKVHRFIFVSVFVHSFPYEGEREEGYEEREATWEETQVTVEDT